MKTIQKKPITPPGKFVDIYTNNVKILKFTYIIRNGFSTTGNDVQDSTQDLVDTVSKMPKKKVDSIDKIQIGDKISFKVCKYIQIK